MCEWFCNTDEKPGVQLLFLVMTIVVVVVAEGSDEILVCFSWLLFLLNPQAPKKGPGYWTSSLVGPTLWMSWEDSEAALYA